MEKIKNMLLENKKSSAAAIIIIGFFLLALTNGYLSDFKDGFIAIFSIVSGYLITTYLNKDNKRSDLISTFKMIFIDTSFKKFILNDLTSWFYFIANIVFWYVNISHVLTSGIDDQFFLIILSSFGLLVAIRLILEFFIVIFKIAENTSK